MFRRCFIKPQARVQFSRTKYLALQARRNRIGKALQDGMMIAASRPPFHRFDAAYFRYHQDPNFYYLSGLLSDDEGVLILLGSLSVPKSILFVNPSEQSSEIWNGPMIGLEGASQLGFDEVFPLSALAEKLPEYMLQASTIYTDRQNHKGIDRILEDIVFKQKRAFEGIEIRDYWGFIGDFRLIKDDYEIELMQTANHISGLSHQRCMQVAHAGMTELELQAHLEMEMKSNGSPTIAYPSIVASGSNCCCLHYNINSCSLEAGDLVLIDAGCSFEGYASDITRTWPVNAQFSKEQRIIYEIVLKTQKKIIEMVRPGARIPDLQDATIRSLTENLINAGVLSISMEAAMLNDTYKAWYPHGVSHWLGLNVHDAGRYLVDSQRRPLEAGMVITVEPGIYIQNGSPFTADCWHGIGIRIEDDILVTNGPPRNLTNCPKEISELEALRAY